MGRPEVLGRAERPDLRDRRLRRLGNRPTDEVLVYDLATHAWSEAPPLPAPRGGHAAVVLGGKIHVLGGGNSESTFADHSVFDPATNQWTDLAPLRRAKGSVAAVVFGGRIFAIGGRSGSFDFGDVDIYDAAANRWAKGSRIGPRGTAGAAVYRGAIYVFGGESQARAKTLNGVMRLTSAKGLWRRVSKLPTARNYVLVRAPWSGTRVELDPPLSHFWGLTPALVSTGQCFCAETVTSTPGGTPRCRERSLVPRTRGKCRIPHAVS